MQVLILSACPAPPIFSLTFCDPQASNTIDNVKVKIQGKDLEAGLRRPRVLRLSVVGAMTGKDGQFIALQGL